MASSAMDEPCAVNTSTNLRLTWARQACSSALSLPNRPLNPANPSACTTPLISCEVIDGMRAFAVNRELIPDAWRRRTRPVERIRSTAHHAHMSKPSRFLCVSTPGPASSPAYRPQTTFAPSRTRWPIRSASGSRSAVERPTRQTYTFDAMVERSRSIRLLGRRFEIAGRTANDPHILRPAHGPTRPGPGA